MQLSRFFDLALRSGGQKLFVQALLASRPHLVERKSHPGQEDTAGHVAGHGLQEGRGSGRAYMEKEK